MNRFLFDPSTATVSELLATNRQILLELKDRGVVLRLNAPTEDLAEQLVPQLAMNWR